MAFYMLQKPTRKGVHTFYDTANPSYLYKGPYDRDTAFFMKKRYLNLEKLTSSTSFNPKVVKIKGPSNFVLTGNQKHLSTKEGYFLRTNFYGEVTDDYNLETTSYGVSPVIVSNVTPVDPKNEDQVFQWILQASARCLLGIGDIATRNFLVHDDEVLQFDVDANRGIKETYPSFIDLVLPKLSKDVKKQIEQVWTKRKSSLVHHITAMFGVVPEEVEVFRTKMTDLLTGKVVKSKQVLDLGFFGTLKNDKLLKEYPLFSLRKTQQTEEFTECRNNSINNCGAYVAAFLGLYKYGFYSSKKGFSITWVRTSVYTTLLEDMSISFIKHHGWDIVKLITDLEEDAKNGVNYTLAAHTATKIYQLMSSYLKNRELSFWSVLYFSPRMEHYDPERAKIFKTLNLERVTIRDLPTGSLGKVLAQGVSKMLVRAVLYEALKDLEEEDETKMKRKSNDEFTSFNQLFNPETTSKFEPDTTYRKEITGFVTLDEYNLSTSVCKSIMQKAPRVGLPLKKDIYKNLLTQMVKPRQQLTFTIPQLYTDDKHTAVRDRKNKEAGFDKFFTQGMRSSNAYDIEMASGDNLYYEAMKPYFKMIELGYKPTSGNFFK